MNSTNFIQTGGWPLDAERLQEMQTAYSIFNSLGALAGNLTIISGCETVGTTVGNGFVYINGELLEFREATVAVGSTVIIIEEAVNRAFKNGISKQVHAIRYATFGTAGTSWLWTNFKKVDPLTVMMGKIALLEKKTAIFTAGGAAFPWFRPISEIPAGFQEIIDIRGRTIIGYDPTQTEFNSIGKAAGQKNKTLSIAEIPEHDHGLSKIKNYTSNFGTHGFYDRSNGAGDGALKTDKTGGGQSFSILNPYKVAAYIEFIG
ncbi:hypothetical protein [Flavobacterium aquicola]|uniref:Microcystin-dependent protein n=1 Tax=Flavobacterium aquicola TaxID=1682742 RepID=A0A3E0ES94_9FLAO|nr:hypothetical protein [Flavobacterium aquicola]REH00260.1 hypothetical protein C8P67_103236 [Flavobacterium aquicola]